MALKCTPAMTSREIQHSIALREKVYLRDHPRDNCLTVSSCVVCLAVLSKSYLRRRLTSESTKHVVPTLREAQSRAFLVFLTSNTQSMHTFLLETFYLVLHEGF